MTELIDPDPRETKRLQRAAEKIDKVIGPRCAFERGVKLITREKRLDRAVKWFQRFIQSRSANVETAEREIEEARTGRITWFGLKGKGFAAHQVVTLRSAFAEWKAEEKSRKAKESREARGKRGRVRSKSDKRLGARLPGS